jgi:plastocyanin
MKRLTLVAAICLVSALGLVAALGGVAGARASTTIKVDDDFFSPDKKTVSKGTKVKFKWVGSDDHNVVKKSGPGRGFDSGVTDAPGVNLAKKFKKTGKYKIICTLHEDMKMTLKVK